MSSPGEFVPTKTWVRFLLKNLVIFSHKTLGTTSEKKKFAIFSNKILGTSSPIEKLLSILATSIGLVDIVLKKLRFIILVLVVRE
jgi:hypothetical protein